MPIIDPFGQPSRSVGSRAAVPARFGLTRLVKAGVMTGSLLAATSGWAGDLGLPAAVADTKLYFTAPLRWDKTDWTYFGGTLLAVAAAHQYDSDVRDYFVGKAHAAAPGKDPDSLQQALPAAALVAGTFVASMFTNSHAGYQETWSMLEAGALSSVTSLALKYAAGRTRPNDTADPNDWFNGGSSFPSLHTTAAFAIGTVLAESGNERYRWIRRLLGYGIAGGTAYLRMRDNVHWLSDTVAGAAIGMATAHFVMNRRTQSDSRVAMTVLPTEGGGMMLSWSMPLD